MMKKIKLGLPFYIGFFILTLLVELYCFVNWSDDIISVIAISVVLFISLYLLLDEIVKVINQEQKEYYKKLEEENKVLKESINQTINKERAELLQMHKSSVEILIKSQKSFTEAILKNQNKNKRE